VTATVHNQSNNAATTTAANTASDAGLNAADTITRSSRERDRGTLANIPPDVRVDDNHSSIRNTGGTSLNRGVELLHTVPSGTCFSAGHFLLLRSRVLLVQTHAHTTEKGKEKEGERGKRKGKRNRDRDGSNGKASATNTAYSYSPPLAMITGLLNRTLNR
jgi:chromatin remodeling complex protein RSC6